MDILSQLLTATGIGVLVGPVVWLLLMVAVIGIEHVNDRREYHRRRRIARIEAELDAKSEELRRTILGLAEQLAVDRDEASQQMTRAAYLASGVTTPPRSASDA